MFNNMKHERDDSSLRDLTACVGGNVMYERIMVPLDGSRAGQAALPTAVDIARKSSATLHVVTIVAGSNELSDTSSRHSPRRYLNRLSSRIATQHHIDVEVDLLSDAANGIRSAEPSRRAVADVLSDYARSARIDMTVMTTYGRGGFKRLCMGSVAEAMSRLLSGAVLIVPAGARGRSRRPARLLMPPGR